MTNNDQLVEGLRAAIRAAKFALFTINKHGVMPNDSWKLGFDKDIAKAEAALAVEMPWRDIAMAPKDGTLILASRRGQHLGVIAWTEDGWECTLMGESYALISVHDCPTHWMPLPNPPESSNH